MKYFFSDTEYVRSHMRKPKGTGHWAFVIKNTALPNIATETYVEQVDNSRTDTIFWVSGTWTLTEAKKRASVLLAANAVPTGKTIYIAP